MTPKIAISLYGCIVTDVWCFCEPATIEADSTGGSLKVPILLSFGSTRITFSSDMFRNLKELKLGALPGI